MISAFITAVAASDLKRTAAAMGPVDDNMLWPRALRALIKTGATPSKRFRRGFLRVWLQSGDHLRQEAGSDLDLVDGLRILLPQYQGPGLTLYRGDSFHNRCRRLYGQSWTARRQTADGFAQGNWRAHKGGSVVLMTRAPATAIVCAPARVDDSYAEQEYIVDRRRLGAVSVVARYSETATADIAASATAAAKARAA